FITRVMHRKVFKALCFYGHANGYLFVKGQQFIPMPLKSKVEKLIGKRDNYTNRSAKTKTHGPVLL
ncbi:MAG: hypothetical protein V4676_03925, partial [Bacteroidota bacterium]